MAEHTFTYKGYYGSIEASIEDRCLHGEILYIHDLVVYEGQTIEELEKAFQGAVDSYLKTCAEQGLEPDKPFKGTFNVRIGPDLHRQLAIKAAKRGVSLNDLVKEAIIAVVTQGEKPQKLTVEHRRHFPRPGRTIISTEARFQSREGDKWHIEVAKAKQ